MLSWGFDGQIESSCNFGRPTLSIYSVSSVFILFNLQRKRLVLCYCFNLYLRTYNVNSVK